jgi:iron complex outermembrane recepter protein
MRLVRRRVALALGFGVGGMALLAVTDPRAQDQPARQDQGSTADIKVEVTGSNIRRIEGESALPVTVMTRADIARTGATTPMELLQFITANTSAGQVSLANVIGSTTFSQQTASLRGLGASRTLVLINGKRVVGLAGAVAGVDAGVDLSIIPLVAIERVEVLKDGASAIYGSDAIGGVINFIMRQDYTGAEAEAFYGAPTRSGGGSQYVISGTAGAGDLDKDRYNAFFSLSYNEQRPLDQNDRDFSNTSINLPIGLFGGSANTFPAYISTGGIGSLGYPSHCGANNWATPPQYVDVFGARCWFDPPSMAGVQMIAETRLWNFFGQARFQINRDWQAYVNGLYSRQENTYTIQPTPISDQILIGPNGDIPAAVLLPPGSPYYPHAAAAAAGVDGQPLDLSYRCVPCGLRTNTDSSEGGQIVAGLKGTALTWDWDGALQYADSTNKEVVDNGYVRYSQILPLLNGGNVNPFGPNTPQVLQAIEATEFRGQVFGGESKQYGVTGKGTGDVWQLPAGVLSAAMGGEARREELGQTSNPVLATGDISGYGGNFLPVNASRDVWALYGELNIPIVRALEGDVAVRYEHYSDFGGTTNPKVSLRWQPTRQFLMRGSYGTGFVAPSLFELYVPHTFTVSRNGLSDPIRCPVTHDSDDCLTQFPVIQGGNPALQPETAEQMTAGFVLEPFNGLSFSADYFKIRLSNVVGGLNAKTILSEPQYYYLIQRAPPDPQFPDLPGRITGLGEYYVNVSGVHVQGIDLDLRYLTPAAAFGRVRFQLSGTYYIQYDTRNIDGSYTGAIATAYGAVSSGVIPRYRQYASATWEHGAWNATLANTYQAGYTDASTDWDGNLARVGTLSLWDLQGQYTGFRNLTVTLGVKNLFDTNPPVSNQQNTFQLGFDPAQYDPRARFVYGSIKYAFK